MKPKYPIPHPPTEPHRGQIASTSTTFRSRFAGFLGRNWARVNYAYHVEPTWLEINRIDVAIRDLAPAFHGTKVAHLSDFHYGKHLPKGYVERALERTLAEKPDLIALTGDFIDRGHRHVREAAKLFGQLRAPLGVFAVLGNHDFSVHNARGVRRYPGLHQSISDALSERGVKVLRNESVRFDRGDAGLIVAGVDDLWSRESNPQAAMLGTCPDTPRIVLAHNPQSVDQFDGQRFDLLLSGHTHGGQVNWPGLGRVLLTRNAKRWAAGLYPHTDGHIYVNKGVGFGWRFRFGVRPEVAVFTLKPQ